MVFNKCEIIQCPTEKVKERLEKHHVKAELRVISNGIIPDDKNEEDLPSPPSSPYIVACTGRYSTEKDQSTLLEAMRYCGNSKNIQLAFAGRGPRQKRSGSCKIHLLPRKVQHKKSVSQLIEMYEDALAMKKGKTKEFA